MARNKMQQNATPATSLSPAQEQVIDALAGGATITEAAAQAGVDRVTVYRWRQDNWFVSELNRARREARERIQGQYQTLAREAAGFVREVLTDSAAPAAVRLRAALTVLDRAGAAGAELVSCL